MAKFKTNERVQTPEGEGIIRHYENGEYAVLIDGYGLYVFIEDEISKAPSQFKKIQKIARDHSVVRSMPSQVPVDLILIFLCEKDLFDNDAVNRAYDIVVSKEN